MWTRFGDVDRSFVLFDELRRRLDRVWEDFEGDGGDGASRTARGSGAWPRVNVHDTGTTLVLEADVPGMSQKDLRISINDSTLTVEGERKSDAPEGYSVHRQERGALRFSRSFTLPVKTDSERCEATVKDGVLVVKLPKAKEAQPRQIEVRAS
jgi:HSP20 family protein